jgi:hypothetical protein
MSLLPKKPAGRVDVAGAVFQKAVEFRGGSGIPPVDSNLLFAPVLEILQTTEKPLLRSLKALVRSLLV